MSDGNLSLKLGFRLLAQRIILCKKSSRGRHEVRIFSSFQWKTSNIKPEKMFVIHRSHLSYLETLNTPQIASSPFGLPGLARLGQIFDIFAVDV